MRTSRPWLDVSVPLRHGMVHWPGDPAVQIRRVKSIGPDSSCNLTHLDMGAHTGTHMDAPLHFIADGEGMEALPLDAVIGPCRVIAIRHPEIIPVEELKRCRLRRGERVLFKTANSEKSWNRPDFDPAFVHLPAASAQYLVDCGVRTVGVDYLSVGGYKKDGRQTHQILLGARVWLIEGLNLSGIKPGRYDLICLPLKIVGSDGAPARVVLRARR
jgi:arylformamidase